MELGLLNRKLVMRSLWRGTLSRLLMLVVWPWCALMGFHSDTWELYVFIGLIAALVVFAMRGD